MTIPLFSTACETARENVATEAETGVVGAVVQNVTLEAFDVIRNPFVDASWTTSSLLSQERAAVNPPDGLWTYSLMPLVPLPA